MMPTKGWFTFDAFANMIIRLTMMIYINLETAFLVVKFVLHQT